MARRNDYEGYRDSQAKISRDRSLEGRDVAPLPPVADPDRKALCRDDLELFALTYFPARFPLPFAGFHREAIRNLQECTHGGGLFVCALPRGSGKDTLAEVEVLRALLYGLRRFVLLVAATERHAERSLKKIKAELETNELLLADFPEACHPIRKLERNATRARMQTFDDVPTRMEWGADTLILPAIAGSACSGGAVQVAGLTGALRGLTVLGPDGQPVRPDMVILNDCQTRESGKSPTQTADREAIIGDDVLMLAGPTVTIAATMLCTVIYPNDLSDRFLNPDRHPEWRAVRTKMLESFPARMDLWDEYAELRREGMRGGGDASKANEFYAANRGEMDAGALASWPDRKKDGELSGLQSAMNIYVDNPRGFYAECQNDPQADELATGAKQLAAESVAARLSGLERLAVPREATRLTAFVDPGLSVMWYAVVAWNERGGGSVIDYGCYPRQNRTWFEARDARPSLATQFPGRNDPQLVFAGLNAIVPEVLGRDYYREGAQDPMRVERCLIDCGYEQSAVFQWVRQSEHFAVIYPSKGIGRTQTARGVAEWKSRPGERTGWHWRLTIPESGKVRMVQFDPDQWKTRLYGILTVPLGGPTCLTLPGKSVTAHEMIAAHCAAEYSSPVTIRGETFDKWQVRPDRPDNHLFDCLVGACVAAGVAGVQWSAREQGEPEPPKARPKPLTYAERQAQGQGQQRAGGTGRTYAEIVKQREGKR